MYHQDVMLFENISTDLWVAVAMLTVAGLAAGAYSLRVLFKGRAQFDRVDRQGGSALLNKGTMEGAYWFLQPFAKLLVYLRITPNMISWASFVFGAVAGACLAVGHFGSAAFFGTISALLDALDGNVARVMGLSSDAGEVLDAAVDRYVEFFMLAGITIYYREIPVLMCLALMALIGSFMVSYSSAKAEALHVDPPKGSMRRPERALYLLLGSALSPVTIPWLERVREFPIALAHPMIFALGLIGVLANVSAAERFWNIAKAMRAREADVLEARRRVAATVLTASGTEDESGHEEKLAH